MATGSPFIRPLNPSMWRQTSAFDVSHSGIRSSYSMLTWEAGGISAHAWIRCGIWMFAHRCRVGADLRQRTSHPADARSRPAQARCHHPRLLGGETNRRRQIAEVIHRFDLARAIRPFMRRMACNGVLEPVSKDQAQDLVPERSIERYNEFHRCEQCGRIYWKGTHYARMRCWVKDLRCGCSCEAWNR
jgi:Mut7-C RNAse domain